MGTLRRYYETIILAVSAAGVTVFLSEVLKWSLVYSSLVGAFIGTVVAMLFNDLFVSIYRTMIGDTKYPFFSTVMFLLGGASGLVAYTYGYMNVWNSRPPEHMLPFYGTWFFYYSETFFFYLFYTIFAPSFTFLGIMAFMLVFVAAEERLK
jgi:hypothetical protein